MNSIKKLKIKELKENKYYSNCELSKTKTEGRLIAVNKKYLAFSLKNPGEIKIVDTSNQNIKQNQPYIKGIEELILDLEFSPFNNNILSSSYLNNSILIWKIPENGLNEDLTKEILTYKEHSEKVHFINFNPIVEDLIASVDFKQELHIWNISKGKTCVKLKAEGSPTFMSWSPNGDLIGATVKYRFINIFDPRNNKIICKQKISDSFLNTKFAWIDNNLFITTNGKSGINASYQELKLWDIRKLTNNI